MAIQPLRKKKPGPKRQKVDYRVLAQSKGVSRQTAKGRKDRNASKVTKAVRAACVKRDGDCRIWKDTLGMSEHDAIGWCLGRSQWSHMHERRRSQTRGQAPELRHSTKHSLMLCAFHHDRYDGRRTPRLLITALSRNGADGPLKFRLASS